MTTILRASQPAELLGLIPTLAGFTPRRSLVLLPFERGRTYGALRAELPHPDTPLHEYVAHMLGLVCRVPEADAVVFAVYDDAPLGDGPPPWAELLDALCDRAEACELEVRGSLSVGSDAWADLLAGSRHPLSEVPAPPVVPGVGDVSGSQHEGAGLPDAPASERDAVAEALGALAPLLDARMQAGEVAAPADPRIAAAVEALDDVPAFFERVLDDERRPSPCDVAALAWCLNTPVLRDVALVQWARTRRAGVVALGAQLAFLDRGTQVPDDLGSVLLGMGRRPEPERLHAALRRVREAAARLPEHARTGPLVAAAWLSWALGRSTHAAEHLAQAQAIDPNHSMAGLISSMISAGMLPEWLFATRDAT